jgi:hypothetical protein
MEGLVAEVRPWCPYAADVLPSPTRSLLLKPHYQNVIIVVLPCAQNGSADNRLETEAEQEIAAALFDLANAGTVDHDEYLPMMETVKVPKGHHINDLNLTSRKRPRKPNRNYAIFEDPGGKGV